MKTNFTQISNEAHETTWKAYRLIGRRVTSSLRSLVARKLDNRIRAQVWDNLWIEVWILITKSLESRE